MITVKRLNFLSFAMTFLLILSACAPDGSKLFLKNCIGCHRYKGIGGSICPDLTEVTKRRDREWIKRQIKDPSINNPRSTMPGFPDFSEKELNAIVDFLEKGQAPQI